MLHLQACNLHQHLGSEKEYNALTGELMAIQLAIKMILLS
jgi:hypothetical protein